MMQVKPAVGGTQYSLDDLHNKVENEIAGGTIHLKPEYTTPLSANSKTVQNEKAKLEELSKRSVTYQVQNKKYQLNCGEIITRATYQNGK